MSISKHILVAAGRKDHSRPKRLHRSVLSAMFYTLIELVVVLVLGVLTVALGVLTVALGCLAVCTRAWPARPNSKAVAVERPNTLDVTESFLATAEHFGSKPKIDAFQHIIELSTWL